MAEPRTEKPCPACGTETDWYLTCHTFRQGGRWCACLPCDSATEWFCTSEDCEWSYTQGLNPGNPDAEANERDRPSWVSDETAMHMIGVGRD